jgi:hypothetical protein
MPAKEIDFNRNTMLFRSHRSGNSYFVNSTGRPAFRRVERTRPGEKKNLPGSFREVVSGGRKGTRTPDLINVSDAL